MLDSQVVKNVIRIIQIYDNRKGCMCTAKNIKKDGTRRTYNFRLGVKKHLKGGKLKYNPNKFNLICFWDTIGYNNTGQGYRMLNVSTCYFLQVDGKVIINENGPTEEYYRHLQAAEAMYKIEGDPYA